MEPATFFLRDLVDTPKLETQLTYGDAAAAVGFSAPRILQLEDVERAFLKKVLEERRLEVAIPPWRGWLAKFAGSFPKLSVRVLAALARAGMSNITREKAKRAGHDRAVTPDTWLYEQELSKKRPAVADRRTS